MGNVFGDYFNPTNMSVEHWTMPHLRKTREEWPRDNEDSPFDPNYGFKSGRQPRVMIATEAEMDSGCVKPPRRDYCAHLFLELRGCMTTNSPFFLRCRGADHQYKECQFQDQVIRMKEWERERRLWLREKRKAAKRRRMKEETDY